MKVFKTIPIAAMVLALVSSKGAAKPGACDCGPDFCLNDSRYQSKLAAKKKDMTNSGFPPELIALMDLDGACVARVERAPDAFSIKLLKPDGSSTTIGWTADDEKLARKELLNGTLRGYYKFNVSRAFSCCGEPKYDKRPDWDSSLELNLKLVIHCFKEGNGVVCKPGQ